MPSKTSWFNKELLIQSFRNVGWIGIIYAVGLFFAAPLQVLMDWGNKQRHYQYFYNDYNHNVFSFMFEIQFILMIAVPIMLAIFLFRYLQTKTASDFMHSLPIKRTTLFSQYVGLGIFYLVIPVLLNAVVLIILNRSLDLDGYFTLPQVFSWAGITIIFVLLIFMAGVFVGTMTGLSAVQGVLTLVLLLFPTGILGLIAVNLDLFLFGFLPNYYLEFDLIKLSPITNAADFSTLNGGISPLEMVVYLIFILIFYALGMWIYKRRHLESVSQAIVFTHLRPVFKYGVTFCSMLIGGYYFGDTQNSMSWAIFGYVAGSLIGYFIAEMVLQKTWRVFTHIKGYFIYAAAMFLIGLLIHFDVTGYQQRVPELSQIERVYFANNSFDYIKKNDNIADRINYPYDKHKPYFYAPKNIENIQNLHRLIIKNRISLAHLNGGHLESVFIAYELKNGKKIVREYLVPDSGEYRADLNKIYTSKEFKEAEFEVLHLTAKDIVQIRVRPNIPTNKSAVIADPAVIAEALTALKNDIMDDKTYNPQDYESDSTISILLDSDANNNQIEMRFDPSYQQFETVLKKQDMLENAMVTADDISFAVVIKREDLVEKDVYAKGIPIQTILGNKKAIKVTSKEQIQHLWDTSAENQDPSNDYLVGFQFHFKNGQFEDVRSVSKDNIPQSILQQ
jgi:ABC-2 type transport system permease protein